MATIQEIKELALHAAKGTAPANYTNETVNEAFIGELRNLASNLNQFMKNRYDIYQIMVETADDIIPQKVISAMSPFAEIQVVPQGVKAMFKRRVGRDRAKKFLTSVGLSGVYETFRLDTTTFEVSGTAIGGAASVDFERLMDGAEDMAELMQIMTEGLTDSIYLEVQKALKGALNAAGRPARNKYTGSGFDADEMLKIVNTVRAYGSNAVIFAPGEFVAAMGPDALVPAGSGYGAVYHPQDIDAIHNQGYINMFRGTPVVRFNNSFIDESNTSTWLDPQFAYILPTGGEKVVKIVLEGPTFIKDKENYDNSMEVHFWKKIGVAIFSHHNWGVYQNTAIEQTYTGSPYGI